MNYKEFKSRIEKTEASDLPAVFLIYGEAFFRNAAFEALLERLRNPADPSALNFTCETLDGISGNILEAVSMLKTYSLFSGRKIVAILDTPLFTSKGGEERMIQKAKSAFDERDMKAAAKHLLGWVSGSRYSKENIHDEKVRESIRGEFLPVEEMQWIDALLDYCKENRLHVPQREGDAKILEEAIQNQFPGGNRLILTAETIDKRISLFKTVSRDGWIIDCTVPMGERQAEKTARKKMFQEEIHQVLKRAGKEMDPDALAALFELTGFDLNTLNQNLNKLIPYTGSRSRITRKDIEAVVFRSRQDPVFALTHAISEKDASGALFYLNSLLRNEFHPIQIIGVMANQIRKLLVVKDFIESEDGKSWSPGCNFIKFREEVVPALERFDRKFVESVREEGFEKSAEGLKILKHPGNSYPIFMLMEASDRFGFKDLISALEKLRDADRLLKTTSRNPRFILERVILGICGKEDV
jgi:DNA polymerase-3 subunit delta